MTAPAPAMSDELDAYDAGLLSDYGGGNVDWWQDYIRAELGRAHEHYAAQIADRLRSAPAAGVVVPVEEYTAIRKGLLAVNALIDESKGVYGLHLNGDPSPWTELLSGGKYEDWLLPFCDACDVMQARDTAEDFAALNKDPAP